MKTCYRCKLEKEDSQFHKRGKGLQSLCKECRVKYIKEHYKNNRSTYIRQAKEGKDRARLWIKDYKDSLKCQECGENHPACLEFHHLDPTKKEINISQMVGFNKEKIIKEIEKCIVLCSNCHRKLHYNERQVPLAQW